MDWRDENRMTQLERLLERAVELLRENGRCDPYTGEPYDDVEEFLNSVPLREALS